MSGFRRTGLVSSLKRLISLVVIWKWDGTLESVKAITESPAIGEVFHQERMSLATVKEQACLKFFDPGRAVGNGGGAEATLISLYVHDYPEVYSKTSVFIPKRLVLRENYGEVNEKPGWWQIVDCHEWAGFVQRIFILMGHGHSASEIEPKLYTNPSCADPEVFDTERTGFRLPYGRWFTVVCRFVQDRVNGLVDVKVDGRNLYHVEGICTKPAVGGNVKLATASTYMSNPGVLLGRPTVLFFKDLVVQTEPFEDVVPVEGFPLGAVVTLAAAGGVIYLISEGGG